MPLGFKPYCLKHQLPNDGCHGCTVNTILRHSLTSSTCGEDEGYLSCRRVVGPRLWQAEVIRGATLVTKEVTPSSHKSSVDIPPLSQLAPQPGTD